jgi:hypothetical protein
MEIFRENAIYTKENVLRKLNEILLNIILYEHVISM